MPTQYKNKKLLDEIITTIKFIRNSKKITLEVFYFDTGIHLARIEQGKTNLTVSTLYKICEYFDISLREFFSVMENPNYDKNK